MTSMGSAGFRVRVRGAELAELASLALARLRLPLWLVASLVSLVLASCPALTLDMVTYLPTCADVIRWHSLANAGQGCQSSAE